MTEELASDWFTRNQRYLSAALAVIKSRLERFPESADDGGHGGEDDALQQQLREAADGIQEEGSPLDTVCRIFHLSSFERNVLLLCAGAELDSAFPSLCAAAQEDPSKPQPTFGLALALFPDAHWSALSPGSPLRRWQLLEVGPERPVTRSPLRIDERVLHYLTGVNHPDDRLSGMIEPLRAPPLIVPSHSALVEQIAAIWSAARNSHEIPAIVLNGRDEPAKRSIALAACAALGLAVHRIAASTIPANPSERDSLVRLWEREAVFGSSALLLECGTDGAGDAVRDQSISYLVEHVTGPLVISAHERRLEVSRAVITFNVEKPASHEQYELWRDVLGSPGAPFDEQLKELVSQFNLSAPDIASAGAEAAELLSSAPEGQDPGEFSLMMHRICCRRIRLGLQDLAIRIEPRATWDDIVLPERQLLTLREIAMHIRRKEKVCTDWGFATKGLRGLGTFALFSGVSGTGKTMAAEVLANDLELDLFKIDLSQVISKYIGETEKNLRRVFDAAEGGGVLLLFDEADALFGKRSEVKDSHDRYANIEISYLLQRMEAYRGLAVLTTNAVTALDPAFMRRIPFVVRFPFPDDRQRTEIWQKVFPADTPKDPLDYRKLARLTVTGGNIHNISLNAAFLAADAGEPVRMEHLLKAARSEYAKLEKPLSEAEIGGWV